MYYGPQAPPGTPVLFGPLEAGEMVIASSSSSNIRNSVPVAAVLSRPLEAGEMAIKSSILTSLLVPVAAVLSRPLEAREIAISSSSSMTSTSIPVGKYNCAFGDLLPGLAPGKPAKTTHID